MGKHSAERTSPLPLVLAVVALLAIGGAAVYVYRALAPSSSTAAPAPTTTTTALSASSSSASTSATASPTTQDAAAIAAAAAASAEGILQGCVARQQAAGAVIEAATVGADHWSDHVQGETDLENKTKSLIAVKNDVWGPTRAAGPTDVKNFQEQLDHYSGEIGCQSTTVPGVSADLAAKLEACGSHQRLLDTYIGSAIDVIVDWQTHLSEMADHASGHTNSYVAQANWLKRWREAPIHLTPYRAAEAALQAAPTCTV